VYVSFSTDSDTQNNIMAYLAANILQQTAATNYSLLGAPGTLHQLSYGELVPLAQAIKAVFLGRVRQEIDFISTGSVDVYFGPQAPAAKEANWVQTVRGKGWFTILRLYGPLESWFEKSWRPGEFEPIT
jgi:Protein of unknown function (DUF1214)